jgi:hypothetical protein
LADRRQAGDVLGKWPRLDPLKCRREKESVEPDSKDSPFWLSLDILTL